MFKRLKRFLTSPEIPVRPKLKVIGSDAPDVRISQSVIDSNETILGIGKSLSSKRKSSIDEKYLKPKVVGIPDSFRKGHVWTFGTTRSGKTRIMENIIEQDIRKGYSTMVFDPKGDTDLFRKIVQVAMECDRHEDLVMINPIFPEYSAIIDPLSHHDMIEELVGHIVSGVSVGKDPFFFNVAYSLSSGVVEALDLLAKFEGVETRFNFNDVKNYISVSGLKELLDQVQAVDRPDLILEKEEVEKTLARILENPPDYFNKVSNGLAIALQELTTGHVGKIVGTGRENRLMDRLMDGKRVIAVMMLGSMLTRRASYTLAKVLLSMVQSMVGRYFARDSRVNPPLTIHLDEAQNVLYYGIEELFAKAGGANVWIHGYCQSRAQLSAELGENKANTILDNCNTRINFRVPDKETAKYVADHFGNKRTLSTLLGMTDGSITSREMEIPVVEMTDVLKLQPRQFYLHTYSGQFKGKTMDISPLYVDVAFPKSEGKDGY